MDDPLEWMTAPEAAQALSIGVTTVTVWAQRGKLAGSVKTGRGWLVARSEVERILEEREQAVERRLAKWWPMTDRRQVHGHAHDDGEGQHA